MTFNDPFAATPCCSVPPFCCSSLGINECWPLSVTISCDSPFSVDEGELETVNGYALRCNENLITYLDLQTISPPPMFRLVRWLHGLLSTVVRAVRRSGAS